MSITLRGIAALLAGVFFLFDHNESAADQTNFSSHAAEIGTVKTDFIPAARLSPREIKQVLQLAKASGIASPGEISTFNYLPTGGRGINVNSVKRIEGRNISFDTVIIAKQGWVPRKPEKGAKQLGMFWADANAKYSTLQRRFKFKNTSILISIGEGVDVAVADKVIPMIDAKNIRIDDDWTHHEFEALKDSKPVSINKSEQGSTYELRFDEPAMRLLMFNWKDGQVVVTGVAYVSI